MVYMVPVWELQKNTTAELDQQKPQMLFSVLVEGNIISEGAWYFWVYVCKGVTFTVGPACLYYHMEPAQEQHNVTVKCVTHK